MRPPPFADAQAVCALQASVFTLRECARRGNALEMVVVLLLNATLLAELFDRVEGHQRRRAQLRALLTEYASRHSADIARARLDRVHSAALRSIFFAWAGGLERGQAHYYRIQGPSFLIEYDNIQNNANHIHSVWRDFNGDFGLDLLAVHYQKDHR